jgi:hypothetical protein
VFRITKQDAGRLTDKQIRLLADLAQVIAAARQAQQQGNVERVRKLTKTARNQAEPLVRKLRASGDPSRLRLAQSILASLPGRSGSRGADPERVCRGCHTVLSKADTAARRVRHRDCS